MTMDSNRIKMLAAVLTGVVVLVLGFLVGVEPQLSAASTASAQQDSVEQQNDTLRSGLASLETANSELSTLKGDLATLQSSVPSQASLSTFLTELDGLASASGTTITAFTSADAAAYAPVAPVADATTTDAGSSDETETASPSDLTTPVVPTAPQLVTDPQITTTNFSSIPITVSISGSYAQALDFLSRLQGGSRLFLVTTFASAGSSESGDTGSTPDQWTVGGLVYVLQDAAATQAEQAAETPTTTAEGTDGTSSDTAAGE
jgi:Tfp pilus assembly protein PilO